MADEGIGAALVSAAGNLVTTIGNTGISAAIGKKSQRRQYNYEKKLMAYQAQLNQQQWEKENAYNMPSAQMARLRAAGLNPNLVAGNISGQGGSLGGVSGGSVGQYQAPDPHLDQIVDDATRTYFAYQNYIMAKKKNEADVNYINTQAEASKEQTLYTAARRIGQVLSNDIKDSTSWYQKQSLVEQYRRLLRGNVLLGQQAHLNAQKYQFNQRKMDLQEELMQLQWERLQNERQRTSISYGQYLTNKNAIETKTRIAQKEYNMNYQDWKAMRFGNIAGKYSQALSPLLNFGSALLRKKR